MTEDICIRCGKCCYCYVGAKKFKCRFLIKVGKDKYHCRIYANRLGTEVHKGFVCNHRMNSKVRYGGCPYDKFFLDAPMADSVPEVVQSLN